MAKQLNDGTMLGVCSDDVPTSSRFATWEMGYSHFHFRAGLHLPETEKLIVNSIRPSGRSVLNLLWEPLSHAASGALVCVDDTTWSYKKAKQNCAWTQGRSWRCGRKKGNAASAATANEQCPVSCGTCA